MDLLLELFLWYLIWGLLTWCCFLASCLVALLINARSIGCWWASHVVYVVWAVLLVVIVSLLTVVRCMTLLVWGLLWVTRLLDNTTTHVVSTGWSQLWNVILWQGCSLMMVLLPYRIILAWIDRSCPNGTPFHVSWILFVRYFIRGSFLQRFSLLIIYLTVAISRHVRASLILVTSMMILFICAIRYRITISSSWLLPLWIWR